MIAPGNFLPIVRHSGGRLLPLDPDWLVESIARAARPRGHSLWWAQQVGRAIISFLRDDAPGTTLTPGELNRAVRDVLTRVGAPDVAEAFHVMPPRVRLSLWRLVADAGGAFELGFYPRLRAALADALRGRVSVLEICDSRAGIKLLCARRRWRTRCRDAEQELLASIEGIIAQLPLSHGLRIEIT